MAPQNPTAASKPSSTPNLKRPRMGTFGLTAIYPRAPEQQPILQSPGDMSIKAPTQMPHALQSTRPGSAKFKKEHHPGRMKARNGTNNVHFPTRIQKKDAVTEHAHQTSAPATKVQHILQSTRQGSATIHKNRHPGRIRPGSNINKNRSPVRIQAKPAVTQRTQKSAVTSMSNSNNDIQCDQDVLQTLYLMNLRIEKAKSEKRIVPYDDIQALVADLSKDTGPTVNRLLPAAESQAISELYHQLAAFESEYWQKDFLREVKDIDSDAPDQGMAARTRTGVASNISSPSNFQPLLTMKAAVGATPCKSKGSSNNVQSALRRTTKTSKSSKEDLQPKSMIENGCSSDPASINKSSSDDNIVGTPSPPGVKKFIIRVNSKGSAATAPKSGNSSAGQKRKRDAS
ncbi:MAG: hypothetical protein M1820_006174 [Bogoriella megaspora]|nr:MAG: hypothetical protein M1820_006174 [Bogoriella megaspora]